MKVKSFLNGAALACAFWAALSGLGHAAAQSPERIVTADSLRMRGDTLLFGRDTLILKGPFFDGAYFRESRPEADVIWRMRLSHTGDTAALPHMTVHYRVPKWSVYRRSVTVWGITFSTGQAPFGPPYPAGNSLDAEVLSFPLQPAR